MNKRRQPHVHNDHSKVSRWKTNRFTMIGIIVAAAIAAGIGASSSYRSTATAPPPNAAPVGMKWIPGGEFTMGTDDANSLPNERPAHRVRLDGYWIDETPVTNAQFRRFVEATGHVTTA